MAVALPSSVCMATAAGGVGSGGASPSPLVGLAAGNMSAEPQPQPQPQSQAEPQPARDPDQLQARCSPRFVEQVDPREIDEGEILGKGSFGLVLRAKWKGRDVAVKVFQSSLGDDSERSAFQVELHQLSQVSHPNIIGLYGASMQPPHEFLVMEYADCGSLYKVLHTIKPQVPYHSGHAVSWILQCAYGIQYLHQMKPKAIIHRDLKSPNLLLVNGGLTLKICDFGTACYKQTIMTNNKGSAAWMAPEVFKSTEYTEKCDIFSWGIIFWEVLTRRLPFEELGGNDYMVLWAVHQGKRPLCIAGCPDIIEKLITRCWAGSDDYWKRPDINQVVQEMQFIQKFFPNPCDDRLLFPEDEPDLETQPSDTFSLHSALGSVKSPSVKSDPPKYTKKGSSNMLHQVSVGAVPEEEDEEEEPETAAVATANAVPSTKDFPETFAGSLKKKKKSKSGNSLDHVEMNNLGEYDVKGYYTPPEDDPIVFSGPNAHAPSGPDGLTTMKTDLVLKPLLPLDPSLIVNAPPGLLGSSGQSRQVAWTEDDSGPIPSDIEVVRGPEQNNVPMPAPRAHVGYLPGMYSQGHSATGQTHGPIHYAHRYPLSDYKPSAQDKGGLNQTKAGSMSPSGYPVYGEDPSRASEDETGLIDDKKTANSARRLPPSMFQRYYQNPIGNIYHGPGTDEDHDWQWGGGSKSSEDNFLVPSVTSRNSPIYTNPTAAPQPQPGPGLNSFLPRQNLPYLAPSLPKQSPHGSVGQNLFALQEESNTGLILNRGAFPRLTPEPKPPAQPFKKGHRRSQSYGSTSDQQYGSGSSGTAYGNLTPGAGGAYSFAPSRPFDGSLAPPGGGPYPEGDGMGVLHRSFTNLNIHEPPPHPPDLGTMPHPQMYQPGFFYGQDLMFNELLDPELRPVPPQPNCPQSMKIYEDHKLLASEFLDAQKEISELLQLKTVFENRLAKADLAAPKPQSSAEEVDAVIKLQTEKDQLLQFQDKLSTQLQLINRAKNKQLHTQQSAPAPGTTGVGRSASHNGIVQGIDTLSLPPNLSSGSLPPSMRTPPTSNLDDGWVLVQKQQQQQQPERK